MSNNTKWTPEQYAAYLKSHAKRLPADDKKPVKRSALVSPLPREDKGMSRVGISFTIFSVRPCDWDGYDFKSIIDLLVHASLLDGDEWNRLECIGIYSEKVHSKEEERTIITIETPWKNRNNLSLT